MAFVGRPGIARKLKSMAADLRMKAVPHPPKRGVVPPPPPPPVIEHTVGVAALLPSVKTALPPRPRVALPKPLAIAHPRGLASKIPPFKARFPKKR
jgi:hypothetical protein